MQESDLDVCLTKVMARVRELVSWECHGVLLGRQPAVDQARMNSVVMLFRRNRSIELPSRKQKP